MKRVLLALLLLAAPAWADWSTGCGFNFRETLAGATDDANQTWIGEDSEHEYPTEITACGETINVGWNVNTQAVNWSIGGDPRFDGIVYKTEGLTDQATLRIDLPATGTYSIRAAFGSPYWMDTTDLAVVFKDDGTAFKTLSDSTNRSDGQYWDANGTLRTSEADWISNNTAITHTFTSTTFTIDLGGTSAVENQPLAHLWLQPTGGAEPTPTATADPTASPTAEPTPTPGSLIIYDDFDTGAVSTSWDEPIFKDAFYYPNTAAQKITEAPSTISGIYVAHYRTMVGTNDDGPMYLRQDLDDVSEIWVSWYDYFDGAYCWPTGSQKMLRIGNFSGGAGVRKDFTMVTRESGTNVGYEYQCDNYGEGICDTGMGHNSEIAHPEDQWVHWELHFKLNTPGESDGFIKLYKNDALYLSDVDEDFRGSDTTGFDSIWIGGNYSMEGGIGTLACSGSRFLDNVGIYSGGEPEEEPNPLPTPTPVPPTPTATATPDPEITPTATPTPEPTAAAARIRFAPSNRQVCGSTRTRIGTRLDECRSGVAVQ